MLIKSAYIAVIGLILSAGFVDARAQTPTNPGAVSHAPAAAANDPAALSAGFWGEWQKTKSSKEFTALTAAVDCGCTVSTAKGTTKNGAPNQAKAVVDIAITRPDEAARMMGEATASIQDPISNAALATVVNMRIPPEVREAAAPLVAPQARARVEKFRANLSTGIPGLPGIYLGDNDYGGQRADVPSGYTPVAGGSRGCGSRL